MALQVWLHHLRKETGLLAPRCEASGLLKMGLPAGPMTRALDVREKSDTAFRSMSGVTQGAAAQTDNAKRPDEC